MTCVHLRSTHAVFPRRSALFYYHKSFSIRHNHTLRRGYIRGTAFFNFFTQGRGTGVYKGLRDCTFCFEGFGRRPQLVGRCDGHGVRYSESTLTRLTCIPRDKVRSRFPASLAKLLYVLVISYVYVHRLVFKARPEMVPQLPCRSAHRQVLRERYITAEFGRLSVL